MDTRKYDIDNKRVITRVLPFFVRGKWVVKFLLAISSPLLTLHSSFKAWGLRKLIEASITSQPMSLVWYLNYIFREKFKNEDDTFVIITDNAEKGTVIWYLNEQIYHEEYSPFLFEDGEEENPDDLLKMVTENFDEVNLSIADIVIVAPQINETDKYKYEDYLNAIRYNVDKYIVCSVNYDIEIDGLE